MHFFRGTAENFCFCEIGKACSNKQATRSHSDPQPLISLMIMKIKQYAKDQYKHIHFYTTLRCFSYAASLDFPCPLPAASPLANTHSFCKDPHKFRELMCQEGQHGCEGTQSSSKENKEGKLLFWVN